MSPWGLIGWLLAGLLALAVSLGLYFLSLALGWAPPWLAPALLWLPLALYGLLRLLLWFVARSRPPRLPLLDPSNPFTGQWEALKSGLPASGQALYLLVGDDDEAKRSLLIRSLGQAEYQAAPAGPDGLSLWAADGRAWLNVPAALWTDQVGGADPAAAAVGDWGHLMKLLPGFPGPVAGLVILVNPERLKAEGEALGSGLARKLSGLNAALRGTTPWWLILHPLEKLPEGRRLEEALRGWSGAGSDTWDRPFGLDLPEPRPGSGAFKKRGDRKRPPGSRLQLWSDRRPDLAARLGQGLADLGGSLTEYLRLADCSPLPPPLSREVLPLTDELEQLPLGLLASGLDDCRKLTRLECRGLYLTLDSPAGPGQFSRMLFQHLIPGPSGRGRGPGSPFFRRLLLAGCSLILVIMLILLVYGQWRGGQVLALAEELRPLLNRTESRTEGPPPIAGLALGTDLVLKMEKLSGGPARLYRAPDLALIRGRVDLAAQIQRNLANYDSVVFSLALAEWAGYGLRPLTFPVAQDSSSVLTPAFATGAGRRRAADLLTRWEAILGPGAGPQTALQAFDRQVLQTWRRAAEDLDTVLAVNPENLKHAAESGLKGCTVGPEFLDAAGKELTFLRWSQAPQWVRLSREFSLIKSWVGAGDLAADSKDYQAILKRLGRPDMPLGLGGVDKLRAAGQALQDYERALNGLTPLARTPKGLAALAEEMFAGTPPPPERSSLIGLQYSGREVFNWMENLAGVEAGEDRELVGRLLMSPARWLVQGSVAAAARSLEDEWHRKVLLPAKDLTGVERAEFLLGEEGAVAAFREGPARSFLTADRKGYRSAEALGQAFPWSRDFLKFINTGQEAWRKSAGGLRNLKVSALLRPVRAEGPALLNHPLGVRLKMVCEAAPKAFEAETFNRPANFEAEWTPKECGPLTLTVVFRDFTLTKQYVGPAGFNRFVKAAAKGEIRLSADDFPDRVHLLKAAGAETVILAIDLERGPELIKTLNTPLPKLEPPVQIIAADSN